mgnify:CR=1 FL=1
MKREDGILTWKHCYFEEFPGMFNYTTIVLFDFAVLTVCTAMECCSSQSELVELRKSIMGLRKHLLILQPYEMVIS